MSAVAMLTRFAARRVNSMPQTASRLGLGATRWVHTSSKRHQQQLDSKTDSDEASQSTADFGFKQVPEHEKERLVGEVFRKVANKYDIMNDVMSAGIHRVWKDQMVRSTMPHTSTRLLDVAGGTGDIAFRFVEQARVETGELNMASPVVCCDINPSMIEVGRERAVERGMDKDVVFVEGNAEKLPFDDCSFDAFTIAFGIRNVTHIDQALREAYRVLVPGGRFTCLEFSHVENPLIRSVYDTYSFQAIPVFGEIVAQDMASYQYLVESIRKFPTQTAFKSMIEDAGFREVQYENLTFGVACIHSGFKL